VPLPGILLLLAAFAIATAAVVGCAYFRRQRQAPVREPLPEIRSGNGLNPAAEAGAAQVLAPAPSEEPKGQNADDGSVNAGAEAKPIEGFGLAAGPSPAIRRLAGLPQHQAEPVPAASSHGTPHLEGEELALAPVAATEQASHRGDEQPRAEARIEVPEPSPTVTEIAEPPQYLQPEPEEAGAPQALPQPNADLPDRDASSPAGEPPPASPALKHDTLELDNSGGQQVVPMAPIRRPRAGPAVHRDRRGARRSLPASGTREQKSQPAGPLRQADAKLRLTIDSVRRHVRLSVVLSRPEGFPAQAEIDADGRQTVSAYDETRYDDVDCIWSTALLAGELRFSDAAQSLEWLRSARSIHIFAPGEPDFLSVPSALAGIEHIIIARDEDAQAIETVAAAAGSAPLAQIAGWPGMPPGWTIFTGYTPMLPVPLLPDPRLRSLDPGSGTEITLCEGLRVRGNQFAEGYPPRILVEPLPANAVVLIGGHEASRDDGGAWTAPGWEQPGSHLIDVIGGPSLSYIIQPDPGAAGEWPLPRDQEPFGMPPPAPAAILGAYVHAVAHIAIAAVAAGGAVTARAVGYRAGAQALVPRTGVPAAVGALPFQPAFLLVSWGPRRHQGHILHIAGPAAATRTREPADDKWAAAILSVAGHRLDVLPSDAAARRAWCSAVTAARRLRRRKR
jgi:hypothetical protein